MKKIFLWLVGLTCTFSVFAAYQYEVKTDGISVNENMSLSIHVADNSFFKNYEKFGYYVKNADGTYRNESFVIGDAQGKKFDLGNFTAGETVGFYVAGGGQVLDQFNLTRKNGKLVYLNVSNAGGTINESFKIQITGGEYTGNSEDNGASSGQPLPGVAVALLLGGGALSFMKLRNRKKREQQLQSHEQAHQ